MSNELHEHNINQCLINISDHIIESEMEGIIDKEDSYYPTLLALSDLIEKIIDEEETEEATKIGAVGRIINRGLTPTVHYPIMEE